MATFSSVTRTHVLQAMAEYDTRGPEDFRALYGFAPSSEYPLVHEGRRYDSSAILGVAHRHATGRLATPEEVSNGLPTAVAILRKRGFEVIEPLSLRPQPVARTPRAARPAATRSATTRATTTRSTAARDIPPAICPTCSMTLPATGRCDECG